MLLRASEGPFWGGFGNVFGVVLEVPETLFEGFGVVLGAPGAPFGRSEAKLATYTPKKVGVP